MLSDCERCQSTPCVCGFSYETWATEDIQKLVSILSHLVVKRLGGKPIHVPDSYAYQFEDPEAIGYLVYEFKLSNESLERAERIAKTVCRKSFSLMELFPDRLLPSEEESKK